VIDLDTLCPPGLSGAPVIREDRRDVIGVIIEEQTTTMYERTVIFGRAHHLDVLRSACAAVTGGRPLARRDVFWPPSSAPHAQSGPRNEVRRSEVKEP
jgi:hypothetical protein